MESVARFTILLWISLVLHLSECSVSWSGFSGSSSLNENADSNTLLDDFSAECKLEWEECHSLDIFSLFCSDRSEYKDCSCSISSNPASGLFYMTGSTSRWYIRKNACSNTNCGNYPSGTRCSTTNGCATAGSYSIGIRCQASNSEVSTSDTRTHTVTFSGETPSFSITNLDGDGYPSRTDGQNSEFFSTTTTPGLTVYEWVEETSVGSSWLLGTTYLFRLNTANGRVYINKNPSNEYSYTFSMTICAYSRRQRDCGVLTIHFSGCYQRPTCTDKTNTVPDTHAIGGSLFLMTVPNPTDHFTTISSYYQGLSFAIDSTDLSVATIDPFSGDISTTGNVTVFPNYPDKVYTIVVRVSNAQSCSYTSTCTMTLTATFTNWPIEIRSLDRSVTVHEDVDSRRRLHTIIIFDYNFEQEDNVTCIVTHNDDTTLFEMVTDGNHSYSSYSIWKKSCQDPGCGWLCDLNIGCLSHNITQQYTFSVQCSDAYGSSDTGTLTINIQQNAAPVWTNLPMTIIIDTNAVAHNDVVFAFYYTDYENEALNYNYTITPAQPVDPLFAFDPWGNYYNSPANVTALLDQWTLNNETYTLYVCGTERRNTICSTLTLERRDFCGPTPNCTDLSNSVSDQFPIGGMLFTINVASPGSFTSLSYAIFSSRMDLFSVDSITGMVTTTASLPIGNPPDTSSYSITATVYDTEACGYGTCHLGVDLTFTNFDISIDNMAGVTTNLHEDTFAENTLLTISTSDANSIDGVNCVIDETSSIPANNDKFLIRETATGSNEFMILNREKPEFDYDIVRIYTIAVTCSDLYGSSDSATMTVTIDENAQPVITNLPRTINVDPTTTFAGTQIFTMSTTDAENDHLIHFCNTTDTIVPLECVTDGVVSMRRNVTVPTENGQTYQILMCVLDTGHSHTVCDTLSVFITSSKTNPEIFNLPATMSFNEDTSINTVLFTLSVTDPDALDIHTYTLDHVYPIDTRSKFTFVSTSGVLTLASSFDYELQTTYNLTFSVEDNYLSSLAYKTLYLIVDDVNEAPSLTLHTTTLTTTEGNVGKVIGTLLYDCTDVDAGQTLTLTITSGTYMSYFSLSAGELSFAQNWDFESVSLPTSTVIGLTCSDGVGLLDAGTITVYIIPVNEFAPVPNTDAIELTIFSTQPIEQSLFAFTATDADFADDGQFVYSIPGSGEGSQYFTVSSNGHLFISNYISWYYNYTFEFTVAISDNETNPLEGSVNVTIHYRAPVVDNTPIRPTKCLMCTLPGRLVAATLIICSILIVFFLLHCFIRMKMWKLCETKEEVELTTRRRSKPSSRKSLRQQQKKQFHDMIKEADEEDLSSDEDQRNHNQGYKLDRGTLNEALPKTQPPGPYIYINLPNMIDLPDAAVYNQPSVSASMLPEPTVIPDGSGPYSVYSDTQSYRPGRLQQTLAPSLGPQFLYNSDYSWEPPNPSPRSLGLPTNPGPRIPGLPASPMFVKQGAGINNVPTVYRTQNSSSNTRRVKHSSLVF